MKFRIPMKNRFLYLFFLIFKTFILIGQKQNSNYLFWNDEKRIKMEDFGIKVSNKEDMSFAQFGIDYNVNGFDFMTKNFNNKVRNYMIVSASWIDTTQNVAESIRYQQTLFDLSEIYTRKFRKELKENRKKIISGVKFIEEINSKVLSDFANRRIEYDKETKSGKILNRQLFWEDLIKNELEELKAFSSNL